MLLKVFLLSCILIYSPHHVRAQASAGHDRFRDLIYEAYVLNRMPVWESTLQAMEASYGRQPHPELLYDILLAQYGLIGYLLGTGERDRGARLLSKANDRLEELSAIPGYETTALVFESSFTAYRIALRPIRAVQLGPRVYRLLDHAADQNGDYPRVWIEKGNSAFFTPAIFGGNKENAIDYYQQAIAIFEEHTPRNHRWLYLSTLVSLANAYQHTGNTGLAVQTLEKALEYEPRFTWVKEEMLPRMREATSEDS